MLRARSAWFFAVVPLFAACAQSHSAPVRTAALPPPPDPVVRHSAPLWVELMPGVNPTQCVEPEGLRRLCFENVDRAAVAALSRSLWTSFPSVRLLGFTETPNPGDYVLRVDLGLQALSPASSGGPGWSALAHGQFRLMRDGKELAAESVESRSRADFAYGRALGDGASEVVSAIAMHIGVALGALPESRPEQPQPLPPVIAEPLGTRDRAVAAN